MSIDTIKKEPNLMKVSEPVVIVGDIHGQLSMFDDALALIEADGGAGEPVVFLRDYVDRGPDSAGVLTRSCQRNFA